MSAVDASVPDTTAPGSPYVGLNFYTEDDAGRFFGRDTERTVLISNLRASRLTLLYAQSGTGKSSLLRAGVAPRLRELAQRSWDERGTARNIPVVFSSWRDDPTGELIAEIQKAIHPFLPKASPAKLDQERADPGIGSTNRLPASQADLPHHGLACQPPPDHPPAQTLENVLQTASAAADATLLVILDQFEEYFVYRSKEVPDGRFADELAACINRADLRANFLISIREDAYAGLGDLFKSRISNVYGNYLHLKNLSRESARQAIEKTIAGFNELYQEDVPVEIEPALVDTVLGQLRPDQFALETGGQGKLDIANDAGRNRDEIAAPYLQLVMKRIWETELGRGSRKLRRATLEELGGAQTIARTHVDRALTDLPSADREAAFDILHHLVTPSGTKIALAAADIAEYTSCSAGEARALLDRLAGGEIRILSPVPAPRGRHGGTRYEISHDLLAPAILDWGRRQKTVRLEREKEAAERQADAEKKRARIFRALAIVSVLLLVVASGAWIFAVQQRTAAVRQRDQAIYDQTIAEAVQLGTIDTSLAAQLNLAAYRLKPTHDLTSRLISTENTPLSTSLTGHIGAVNSVAFSPDGRTLASGGSDGTIRLWNMANPAQPRAFRQPLSSHTGAVFSVAFSPDGRLLASGSFGGTVRLWDVARLAHPRALGKPLTGHTGIVLSVAFSPDGRTLASGSFGGTVRLWDVTRPAHPRALGRLSVRGTASAVAFSPDGRTLASGGSDDAVRLWDVARLAHPRALGKPLTGHVGVVSSLAFSPDGRLLASGSFDGTVRLWDIADPAHPRMLGQPLTGHAGAVSSVAFSPDGRTLASGEFNGTIWLWDITDPVHPQPLGEPLASNTGTVSSVAFSPDGGTLASGSDNGTTWLWRLPHTVLTGHTGTVSSVAFSPDGRTLASGSFDGTVRLWDVADPAHPRMVGRPLTSHTGSVSSVAFSPDGRTLASGGSDDAVRLWDVARPAHARALGKPLTGHVRVVLSVAFSPDGRTLASGSFDGTVRLWDVADPAHPRMVGRPLTSHTGSVLSVAFSPDGRTLASGGSDDAVRLWDVARPAHARALGKPLTGHAGAVYSVAFSPDGRTLASGGSDDAVRLWYVADPRHPYALGQPLTGHTGTVSSVAFSPDGRTLASGSFDGTVRLWDVANPTHPYALGEPLTGHTNFVNSVAFSAGGGMLATGSSDDTARLWDLHLNHAIKWICSMARDNLTRKQWHIYIPQLPYQPPCAHH